MNQSQHTPSKRYLELVSQCRDLHENGDRGRNIPSEKTFAGYSLYEQAVRIERMIRLTGAKRMLDYGCGKGKQYDAEIVDVPGDKQKRTIIDFWNVDVVHCYDAGYAPFSRKPEGTFDGVISTDMLEHCAEQDIPWILAELFAYADRFVFASIAAYASNKTLPNGDNAHVTVRALKWWRQHFAQAAAAKPNILWEIWVEERPTGATPLETRFGSFLWLDTVQQVPRV